MEILTLPLLTIGSALALRFRWAGLIAGILVVLLAFWQKPLLEPLLVLIAVIAVLNITSLALLNRFGTIYALPALMLLATVYAFYTNDLASLIVCFIVASVPTYVLVLISEELKPKTAVKYITFMVTATILFVLGIVFIQLEMKVIGSVLLLVGLALEVGIAPFHEWVPDVFGEADPVVVAIIASLAKFVPFLIVFKVLSHTDAIPFLFIFALAVISMFVGNIGALTSNEPAKILAYSTVANMGYVISALAVVVNPSFIALAFAGAFIQLLANSVGKIGFFTALKEGANRLFTFMLAFSMIGVPPLLGFWGKFFILTALVKANLIILAVIFVINSVISVPYYVRLARLFDKGKGALASSIVLVCVLLSLLIYPTPIYESCLRLWG